MILQCQTSLSTVIRHYMNHHWTLTVLGDAPDFVFLTSMVFLDNHILGRVTIFEKHEEWHECKSTQIQACPGVEIPLRSCWFMAVGSTLGSRNYGWLRKWTELGSYRCIETSPVHSCNRCRAHPAAITNCIAHFIWDCTALHSFGTVETAQSTLGSYHVAKSSSIRCEQIIWVIYL